MANKLKFSDYCIEIHCDQRDTASQLLAGQIPFVHRNRTNTIFKTSTRNILLVLKLFRQIDFSVIDSNLSNFLTNGPKYVLGLVDREIRRHTATKSLLAVGPNRKDTVLRPHQQLGVELAEVNDRWGFYYDTRTGKTLMSLKIIDDDIKRNPHHKWLVICPLILINNAWLEDAAKFFPQMKVLSLHASTRDKRLKLFNTNASVYITNIESFADYRSEIEKLGVVGAFVDESSAMKSTSSSFSKESVEFSYTVKRWYLLSGAPAPNGEHEYYRQLQSLDYFGVHQSANQFHNYFFNNISRNLQYKKLSLKPEKREELIALIKSMAVYVDKEDVLKTPGRRFNEVRFQLPKELVENYKQLKQAMYLQLGDDIRVLSPSHAATLNKLNQVTSGFVIDTKAMKHNHALRANNIKEGFMQEAYFLSDYRYKILHDLLFNKIGSDKQVLIWAYYHDEFERIQEMLGSSVQCVYGEVNNAHKNESIALFKAGKVQYLAIHPASGGKGLTLTNAHNTVYFSLGYSYEHWKQSIERIYGDISSQPNFCEYYIMLAAGTVDEVIYKAVQNKGDLSMDVLEHLKGGL